MPPISLIPDPTEPVLQAISHGNVTLPGIPKFENLAEQRRWQLEHMAAVFHFFARSGYVEGMSGHINVRDPELEDAFWMNPAGRPFWLLEGE